MRKSGFQFSIKTVLVVALATAAYLAGRVPWENAASKNIARVSALDRENDQASLYAAVWREIALEYRDDIRESELEWSKQSAKRFGHGGSYVGGANNDEIQPRVKRWKFALSADVGVAIEQLDSLDALVICVWDDPPRIESWDSSSAKFRQIREEERLERWLIMATGEEIFGMLPDSVFDDEPRFVLLAIPNSVEIQLVTLEYQSCMARNVTIPEVATTTFGFEVLGDSFAPNVVSQTLKVQR